MCMAQATAAFITVTRWLHIDNVNWFRYLGYAFTCSLMQAELVVLIAPYVPCYSMNAVGIVLLTHTWMVLGWIGSMHEGFLFEDASWNMFLESGQVSELQVTTKGIFIGITAAGSATGGVFSCGENLLRMILERKGELRDVGRWRTVLPVFA
ncbi:unnamed protein product [Durusdinium trenchii]|uniref:Derlin n=1 Tax=Durusdinium trenchii TaxID=1381693 RepID=A0ABP0QWX1_9DINO